MSVGGNSVYLGIVHNPNSGIPGSLEPYSFKVSLAKLLQSITVAKAKKTYPAKSELNVDDISVTASYSDGYTEDLTDRILIDSSGVNMNKAGMYKILVTYDELTEEIPIEITKELVSISAKKEDVLYQVGDVLDTTDITVTAEYSDDTAEDISSAVELNVDSVDMSGAGTYKIIVTYGEKNAEIPIEVIDPASTAEPSPTSEPESLPLPSIEPEESPKTEKELKYIIAKKEKTIYPEYSVIDTGDIEVIAAYSDGSTQDVQVRQPLICRMSMNQRGEAIILLLSIREKPLRLR